MHGMSRRVGLAALLLVAWTWVALPSAAVAEEMYREFYGRIDRISKKKMIVDNRMGDKVSFVPAEKPRVEDARGSKGKKKEKWKDLKKSDWVTVSWKMMDKPRKAYIIKVMPKKKEAGEDL